MANVPVDPTASYTVAADVIGGIDYQRIKLDIGASGTTSGDVGATNPMPITGTVSVSQTTVISGTVSISGAVQVSGAVSISVMPAVSGTVSVSGAVQVSGTVTNIPVNQTTAAPSVSATGEVIWIANTAGQITTASPAVAATGVIVWIANPTTFTAVVSVSVSVQAVATPTTTTQVAATGALVWLAPTQTVLATVNTIAAGFSVNALVTGAVSISAMPAVSGTISVIQTSATPLWITGTVVAGAGTTVVSLTGSALVSGTVSVLNVVPVTTQASASVTGLPVWFGPAQVVTAVVTGTVSIFSGVSTEISGTVTVNGGTVQISGITAITTMAASGVAGLVVWFGTAQTINIDLDPYETTDVPVAASTGIVVRQVGMGVSTTQASGTAIVVWLAPTQTMQAIATVGTLVTMLGTMMVSVVPGYSVVAQVSGLVSVTGTSLGVVVSAGVSVVVGSLPTIVGTTTGTSGATGMLVWLGVGQTLATLGTIITQLGTQLVTIAQTSVSISVIPTINTIITILGTQIVSVVPMVSVSSIVTIVNLPYVTTSGVAAVSTGLIVVAKEYGRVPVQIVITSTVVGSSTTVLMTVYTGGTQVTAGASFWVPANRLRIIGMNVAAVSSAVVGSPALIVMLATAAVSLSVTATVGILAILPYMPAATQQWQSPPLMIDQVLSATTIGIGILGGTSHTIQNAVISGYFF